MQIYKNIIQSLKENFPEFKENVNTYTSQNIPQDCNEFTKIVAKYLPIKEHYSVEQILDGGDIANDTLYHIAISDDNYNNKSGYGNFCGISAYRANKAIPENLITEEKNEIATAILEKLKSTELSEDYYAKCSNFIKIVGDFLPIKEYYSVDQIVNGFSVAKDVLYYIAKVDNSKNYSKYYTGTCDAMTIEEPDNNNFELMTSYVKLQRELSVKNVIEFQKQSEKALELRLTQTISNNKKDADINFDSLNKTISDNKNDADINFDSLNQTIKSNETALLDIQKQIDEKKSDMGLQNQDIQNELNNNADQEINDAHNDL